MFPSLRRSLISVSKLDSSSFVFHFGNKRFFFYSGSHEIASGTLCDGLYKLDLDLNYHFSHNVVATMDLNVLMMNFIRCYGIDI